MRKPLFVLFLAAMLLALCACREASQPITPASSSPSGDLISDHGQLICSVESYEDAQAVAQLYGITLVDYYRNLALYHTEEDPREVIQRGQENGWPELTLNRTATAS